MAIWAKELFKKVLKKLLFIFFSLIFLYVIVDFSIHSTRFSSASIVTLIKYYLSQVSDYLDIFLPVSFLISIVRTLTEMNINKELLALFSSGLSKKSLIKPLFVIASLLSLICLLNAEFVIPKTAYFMNDFQKQFFAKKSKNAKKNVHSIFLNDQSHLVFSKYDSQSKVLEDIFWIRNFNNILHIEKIELTSPPTAYFLDSLTREQNDRLVKKYSYKKKVLEDLSITEQELLDLFITPDRYPLTKLLVSNKNESLETISEKSSLASLKIIYSLTFFLIVICIFPFCIHFSRDFSPLYVLSFSIFAFICFYAMLSALSILSINQVFSTFTVLWVPCFFSLLIGFYGFFRKQT